MAKAPSIEVQLLELSALRSDATSPASRAKLAQALNGKNNLLAARAATIICESNLPDFVQPLLAAFDRFFASGADKGCAAKTAVANALYTFGYAEAEPFLRGILHVQKEPTYGGSVDAAAELRGICALGLVRTGYRDVLSELAGLLMDPEQQTRQMAVRAVVYAGHEAGAPLLRMKLLGGDQNLDVIAEAFSGLMKLAPTKSLSFLARFLDNKNPTTAESAAMAIAGSHQPAAFEMLQKQWEADIRPDRRATLLLAISMTRQAAAIDFLLQRILQDSPRAAAEAVSAMALYKHDDAIKKKISDAVQLRDEPLIRQMFESTFC